MLPAFSQAQTYDIRGQWHKVRAICVSKNNYISLKLTFVSLFERYEGFLTRAVTALPGRAVTFTGVQSEAGHAGIVLVFGRWMLRVKNINISRFDFTLF